MKGVLKDYKHIAGSKNHIPKEDEAQLAELVKDLSKRGFSMRKPEIQVFGAQFAEARGIKGLAPSKRQVTTGFKDFKRETEASV